jgi:alpha-ketoglutarate-dependent taurine dioxygenase
MPDRFALQQDSAYNAWRDRKIQCVPESVDVLRVHISTPGEPTSAECKALIERCREFGFAVFSFDRPLSDPEPQLARLGAELGLRRLDRNLCAEDSGITAVTVRDTGTDKPYIPYSSRPLSWHTDGYYNPPQRQIRAWLLYCQQDAAEGGANEVMDPELAYIRIRDRDPALIRALMADDVFTIPANQEGGEQIRADQSGPVFSVLPGGQLHMRYSARQRNVIWRDDELSRRAAASLLDLFTADNDHIFRYRLKPGEGLISNNALHRREGFRDDERNGRKRLVYRARYYDRIRGT